MLLRIPEMSAQDSVEMQAVAVAEASRKAVEEAKSQAAQAAVVDNYSHEFPPDSHAQPGTTADDEEPYTLHVDHRSFAVDNAGRWMFEPVRSGASVATNLEVNKPGGTRPNDPMYDQQWNFKMVGAEDAWKKTRGKGAVVAVIDTGVAAESTKKGKQCKDFNTTTFVKGYDFVNKDSDPFDDHGHGTHVAGTIAESTNNNEGVAGLAYESTIMPIKVLAANGSGYSSDIADAIRYAADNGANVINMSLGSNQPSSVIQKACQYA
ncbi:MAG: S8 family serine peptidase, partial [Akkermansiaceae bacterium]|nr:S8 family serine peptidase [Armatimonadota bacterium]